MKTTQTRTQIAQTLLDMLNLPRQPKPEPESRHIVLAGNELTNSQKVADMVEKARLGDRSKIVYITASGDRYVAPQSPITLTHTDGRREVIQPIEIMHSGESNRLLAEAYARHVEALAQKKH